MSADLRAAIAYLRTRLPQFTPTDARMIETVIAGCETTAEAREFVEALCDDSVSEVLSEEQRELFR